MDKINSENFPQYRFQPQFAIFKRKSQKMIGREINSSYIGWFLKNPRIQPTYHLMWFSIKNDNLDLKIEISRNSAYSWKFQENFEFLKSPYICIWIQVHVMDTKLNTSKLSSLDQYLF